MSKKRKAPKSRYLRRHTKSAIMIQTGMRGYLQRRAPKVSRDEYWQYNRWFFDDGKKPKWLSTDASKRFEITRQYVKLITKYE